MQFCGVVLRDATGRRVKLHSKLFTEIKNFTKLVPSEREHALLDIAIECLRYDMQMFAHREYREAAVFQHRALLDLCARIDDVWNSVKHISDRKQMNTALQAHRSSVDIAFVLMLADYASQTGDAQTLFLTLWDRVRVHKYLWNWWRQNNSKRFKQMFPMFA
jgi:hypothetical protein